MVQNYTYIQIPTILLSAQIAKAGVDVERSYQQKKAFAGKDLKCL